jgi:hypothetical protein
VGRRGLSHMHGLTNDQRNQLRHAEGDRGVMRTTTNARSSEPSGTGYIEEKPINLQDWLITVTDAGR